MGFFGGSSTMSGDINDLLNENLNTYDGMSIMEANYAAIAETEMNWNAIMEAAAETEMSYFAQTGEEYVYTEASGFFGKVSEFFKKIWEKVKSIFKKFLVAFGSLFTKDKEFVKKYRETIVRNMKNIPDNAEFKGYKSDKMISGIDDITKAIGLEKGFDYYIPVNGGEKTLEAKFFPDELVGDKYDSSEVSEACRGFALHGDKGTTYDEKEFKDKLFEILHGGDDAPDTFDLTSTVVSAALTELETAKDVRKKANDAYKNAEKSFKKIIKKGEDLEKNLYKQSDAKNMADGLTALNRGISAARTIANAKQTMSSMLLSAVKEYYNQQKRICVRCATFREKTNEGAYVEHFSENAFGSVNLI